MKMIDLLLSLNASISDNLNNQASLLVKELILITVSKFAFAFSFHLYSRFHHTVLPNRHHHQCLSIHGLYQNVPNTDKQCI